MKIIKLIVFFTPILLISCKKDPPIDPETAEPVMPPLTHQGLNTFGCYINGELFVANDGDNYWDSPALLGSFDETENYLGLQGTRNTEEYSDNIRIRVSNIISVGEYGIEMYNDNELLAYRHWGGGICDYYFDTLVHDMASINITYLNEEVDIISGTFYMNIVNENCEGDTLMKITDGRFDFHY